MKYFMNSISAVLAMFFFSSLYAIPVSIEKNDKIPENINIMNLPGEKEYPEHDYFVVYDHEDIDVDYVRGVGIEAYIKGQTVHKYMKNSSNHAILKQFFMKDDEVRSFSVTTYKPDGRKFHLSEKDLYIEKSIKTGFKHKEESWQITYPIPALENGDVVVINYFVISKRSRVDQNWFVQRSVPVMKTSKTISFPDWMIEEEDLGWNWRYTPFNFENSVEPEKSKKMGDYVFKWEFSNIAPYKGEAFSEVGIFDRKYIKFDLSGWKTWGEFSIWYYKDKIKDLFGKKPHETIVKKAEELTKTAKNADEKIYNIVTFVQKLPYDAIHVDFGHGFLPNKPDEILRRGHGDCKDKTILIMALLKVVGINADPVVLGVRDVNSVIYPDLPDSYFDHMIVRIHYPGKENSYVWADGTTDAYPVGELPFGDSDRLVLVIKEKGVKNLIKTASFEHKVDHVKYRKDIKLKITDRSSAALDFSVTGFYEDAVYNEKIMQNYSKKDQNDRFRSYINDFYPFNEVKDVSGKKDTVTGGYTISFRSDVKPGFCEEGGTMSFSPFISDFNIPYFKYDRKEGRKTDIYIGAPDVKETEISIEFPQNMQIVDMPASEKFIFKDVFTISSELSLNGNLLTLKARAEQKGAVIAKEDAAAFYEFIKKIKTYLDSRVYLKNKI